MYSDIVLAQHAGCLGGVRQVVLVDPVQENMVIMAAETA